VPWSLDIHVGVSETVSHSELIYEHAIDASDHEANDLGRRVPDTELVSNLWIECGEEGLVEVLHREALVEGREESFPVHPVQCSSRPVQDLDQA
jgi:hypothetical protein